MEEYSRILIEEYCFNHKSRKSDRLYELVTRSYDISAEATDDEGIFLERCIRTEKDPELREALQDLDDFYFDW
ncbi:MAG: hypothetical protein LKG48_10255 [Lachnospiraceae bacterium]|jgi:hypothetical protein|nr:hypothetical protein [Lachnospiraceae bacterium]MCH4063809.1 hypothetical protein [Lachnospiraceae bacterium]MCH4103469.1 hypothetical protein [Lachnospiraceae bacterium]MCI1310125.1 hypothetical protein [Lachnospiraceae bacterium]MCI1334578.1 hypothetical protein [Lachnospiraceae bacterium]